MNIRELRSMEAPNKNNKKMPAPKRITIITTITLAMTMRVIIITVKMTMNPGIITIPITITIITLSAVEEILVLPEELVPKAEKNSKIAIRNY